MHLGLYDTASNVWEWTRDCWHGSYQNAHQDGSAWLEADGGECVRRVVRDGSWGSDPQYLRSAFRFWIISVAALNYIGFRVVRDL